MAGVDRPDNRFGGRPIEPMIGRDLSPVLLGRAARVYDEDDAVGYELAGNAALFQGDYKIVMNRMPLGGFFFGSTLQAVAHASADVAVGAITNVRD